jgi:hypothetical protein
MVGWFMADEEKLKAPGKFCRELFLWKDWGIRKAYVGVSTSGIPCDLFKNTVFKQTCHADHHA